MALSDCVKCWDTPCRCGWNYRTWTKDALNEFIKILQNVRDGKEPWKIKKR